MQNRELALECLKLANTRTGFTATEIVDLARLMFAMAYESGEAPVVPDSRPKKSKADKP